MTFIVSSGALNSTHYYYLPEQQRTTPLRWSPSLWPSARHRPKLQDHEHKGPVCRTLCLFTAQLILAPSCTDWWCGKMCVNGLPRPVLNTCCTVCLFTNQLITKYHEYCISLSNDVTGTKLYCLMTLACVCKWHSAGLLAICNLLTYEYNTVTTTPLS